MLSEIITSLISIVAGGGLSWLVFYKLNRKEKVAEVDSKVVDNIQDVLAEVKERNVALHDRLSDIQERLNKSEDDSIALKSEVAVLRVGLCSHISCPFRNPALGQKVDLSGEIYDTQDIFDVVNQKGYKLAKEDDNLSSRS